MAATSIGLAGIGWAGRLRSLAFNFAFFAVTALLGLLGLPLLLAPRPDGDALRPVLGGSVLALLRATVGLDCEIRGLDNIPSGACIIAMKHQSAWDTLILPVVLGDPAVVLKRELLWVPFYGWYAARAGSIAIDRSGGARGAAPHGGEGPARRRPRDARS